LSLGIVRVLHILLYVSTLTLDRFSVDELFKGHSGSSVTIRFDRSYMTLVFCIDFQISRLHDYLLIMFFLDKAHSMVIEIKIAAILTLTLTTSVTQTLILR